MERISSLKGRGKGIEERRKGEKDDAKGRIGEEGGKGGKNLSHLDKFAINKDTLRERAGGYDGSGDPIGDEIEIGDEFEDIGGHMTGFLPGPGIIDKFIHFNSSEEGELHGSYLLGEF